MTGFKWEQRGDDKFEFVFYGGQYDDIMGYVTKLEDSVKVHVPHASWCDEDHTVEGVETVEDAKKWVVEQVDGFLLHNMEVMMKSAMHYHSKHDALLKFKRTASV